MFNKTLVGTSSMRASVMVSVPMNCARGSAFSVLGGMAFRFLFGLIGDVWVGWFSESLYPKFSAHCADNICDKSLALLDSTGSWTGSVPLTDPCSGCVEKVWGSAPVLWTLQIPLAGLKDH